jgi:aryl-alcohol dehydrogenase-like predicted oxidoreductase
MAQTPEYFRPLGFTGMYCHPLGFGCYRIADGNPEHEAALRSYLDQGGNLIDTSANYTDGLSETLVGKVVRDYRREDIIVVTKAGYIQGQNMELARSRAFPEVVQYGEGIWHCIHPEFLETQIELSRERLQLDILDVFLLHNPEYFLNHQSHHKTVDASDHLEFYRRIREAIRFLEDKVKKRQLRWYGISSNNFGLPLADPTMTSVNRCVSEAEALSSNHHFRVVQLPLNLAESGAALEPNNDGKTVLRFCQQQGLGVLANRPLNAFSNGRLIRLADFAQPGLKPPGKKELLELLNPLRQHEELLSDEARTISQNGGGSGLAQMLEQIAAQAKSAEHWDLLVGRYVIPPLKRWIADTSHKNSDNVFWEQWLNQFFHLIHSTFEATEQFIQSQQQPVSDRVRSHLREGGYPQTSHSLTQIALGILLNLQGISCVLNGMRRPSYVADAFGSRSTPSVDSLKTLEYFKSFS